MTWTMTMRSPRAAFAAATLAGALLSLPQISLAAQPRALPPAQPRRPRLTTPQPAMPRAAWTKSNTKT